MFFHIHSLGLSHGGEAQGLSPNPLLSQPYPVPKAWLSQFPLEQTSLDTDRLLETEKENKSGGHAGERSGQSDALQWNDTQATSSTHATATSASSADGGSGSTDATNAETAVNGCSAGFAASTGFA